MWDKLLEYGQKLMKLTARVEDNQSDIAKLQKDVNRLTQQVYWLRQELTRVDTQHHHDIEKITLSIENQLLKIQNRLLLESKSPNDD